MPISPSDAVKKTEGGNAGSDAIVQLALHGWRRAWKARVKGMKWILAVIPQPAEKWHASCRHRRFKLTARQAINLDQEQTGLLACAFGR